jgi:hypothetical protein
VARVVVYRNKFYVRKLFSSIMEQSVAENTNSKPGPDFDLSIRVAVGTFNSVVPSQPPNWLHSFSEILRKL